MMKRAVPYLIGFVVPLTVFVSARFGGYLAFVTPLVFFVVTPILDEILPRSVDNLNEAQEQVAQSNGLYDWVIRAWFPVQIATMIYVLWRLTTADFAWYESFGIVLSTGILGGTGINVAHELMHRRNKWDRALAELLTWSVTYTHFCVEHIYGHHKKVATPDDPASARLNESVYTFVPRSLTGGLLSFWSIETDLIRRRRSTTKWYEDRRVRYALECLFGYACIGLCFGLAGVLAWFIIGLIASTMLEIINYVEHYGLERASMPEGKYERVKPHHSWSSTHRLTGWLLFGLPRHADHHFLASRPYSILRNHAKAPQLPAGYAAMFLLSLVPPLWFSVMNPMVDEVRPSSVRAMSTQVAAA
jgi:alkane 1-monooxygenase